MNVELTQEEMGLLLEMLHLAEWMLNAHKVEADPRTVPYDAIEQKFLAVAYASGQFSGLIEYEAEKGTYWHTREFDEAVDGKRFVAEYDNDTFWDELASKMAYRDVLKKVGSPKRLAEMPFEKRFEEITAREHWYYKEFERYGLNRLQIVKGKR